MSYRASGYRGAPGDRSRSPSRFDRRQSAANIYDGRHAGPSRGASDAPRGPRSQFDGPPRGPPPGSLGSGGAPRTLRDAPPLGTTDRGRPFRERDYPERRERASPPPRERTPPRKFNDFPPRDIDVRPARRSSRDGPLSAGSSYSETPPFAGSSSFRGGYRGRGRGDFVDRGSTRGGRRNFDDRGDLFPRVRSPPPPRYVRDLSRDGRESDRRDERRFERRDDERRSDWTDREREPERGRRDPPPGRLESRLSTDSVPSVNGTYPQSQTAPPINPERLAILESSGADTSVRRPSSANAPPPPASTRPSEGPAFLTGRKDSTANRYNSRGSSPPAQAPAVPAFSFSVAGPSAANSQPPQASRAIAEARSPQRSDDTHVHDETKDTADKQAPPINAPTAPKAAPPTISRPPYGSPPPDAPRAPRALELDTSIPPSSRLQGVRSMETLNATHSSRTDQSPQPGTTPTSPGLSRQGLPHLAQPVSPNVPPGSRFGELSAPTGPKAVRPALSQAAMSPKPTFASPRSDAGTFQTHGARQRAQTPPPLAPSGPRNRSFSVSPKVAHSSIPTAPKAARAPPIVPRAPERPLQAPGRALERSAAAPPFVPSGPRSLQWNQWRRPGVPFHGEKPGSAVPAKRDANGEEKERQPEGSSTNAGVKVEERESVHPSFTSQVPVPDEHADKMDLDKVPNRRSTADGHSAAQSFFGKTLEKSEDEIASSSDEDEELDVEEESTLLEAKHARKERELSSQMFDLSAREYRATSPLESIGRLIRFSVSELERINAQREEDLDAEDTIAVGVQVPVVHSSESDEGPEVTTPRGQDTTAVVIHEQEEGHSSVRRVRRRTPEPISLPYLVRGDDARPLEESEAFQENVKVLEETEQEALDALEDEVRADEAAEEEAEADFAEYYRRWREECEGLEWEKEEQEKLERQLSAEPHLEFDTPSAALANPILEGRRLHKFNSEYEFEQVLKQSEETARIEQERQEREAKKKEADMEKEARLPDQQSERTIARSGLIDANRLRDPDSLTVVFSYEPPADTFTDAEQQIFVAAFKETPKKWGEIASLLPGRTYKDCIHHYYANKWDGRFRDNRAKKFKGGRRGRGGKTSRPSRGSALMADLNRNEDLTQPSTDSATGRPKRAAAPTTFGEREIETKSSLLGQSPAKKGGINGEGNGEKPAKKQRRTGEKPGRKPKTQLAALAAAPALSPGKPFLPSNENLTRLEEANLLTNFKAGPAIPHAEGQPAYQPDGLAGAGGAEEAERSKPTGPVAKQGASSYWSVPEQTDFFKYIAHFGTDFGAIASHMGTKTQTMIKNHYQRQIDGGRADLEDAANKANTRIKRGEDIGPPPTPTPIVKRKYDNPQSSTPRALAPQTDATSTDEAVPSPHPPPPKHASPPQSQYQAKPRFTTSAQNTPVPAQRVAPSPLLAATSAPAPVPVAMSVAPHGRGLQHPLGSRIGFLSDHRAEVPRPASALRIDSEPVPSRSQPPGPPQPARTLSNAPDHQFLQNLKHEQEKALRMQAAEYGTEPRPGSIHGHQQGPMHATHAHGSPALQPVPVSMQDRKPIVEERRLTPPGQRSAFMPTGPMRPSIHGSLSGQQIPSLSGTPLSSLSTRGPFHHGSPPSHESSRPGSVPTSASLQPPPVHSVVAPSPAPPQAPAPAPEPVAAKRSNVMSLLNDEPEEPKPAPKRDSLPSAPARVASPAAGFAPATPGQLSNSTPSRREVFGQPAMAHSHFHRPPFGQPGSATPGPQLSSLKHEHASGSVPSLSQAPKQDWQPRMYGQTSQPAPLSNAPALDRDGRPPFYSHRGSALSGFTQPGRAIPSPPPHLQHSRTPSLTTSQIVPPSREQRSVVGGSTPAPGSQSVTGLHPSPFATQQQSHSPFTQPPQLHNRILHAHNSSVGERGSMLPPFGVSRDEAMRREDEARAQHQQREREEQQRMDAIEAERRFQSQRQKEDEIERQRSMQQSAYGRGPPMPHQPMHAPAFSSPFGQSGAPKVGGYGLREMSMAETEHAIRADQHRRHEEDERRRQHERSQPGPPPPSFMREREAPVDPLGRRPEDFLFRRSTPHSGQAYPPPPAGRR